MNLTSWDELHASARRRGIADPQNCRVVCADCGMEPAPIFGIPHFEECEADWGRILFLKQDASGEWIPQGGGILRGTLNIFTADD